MRLYDAHGALHSMLDLGVASEDVQTTPCGRIWVSYFDEGVFGRGIGQQGMVCFDAASKPLFRYAEFAEQKTLPMISDRYAMDVDRTGAVWLNSYTDFPLVQLRQERVEQFWPDFGVLGNAFAVREDQVIGVRDSQLTTRPFHAAASQEPLLDGAADEDGVALAWNPLCYADIAARGDSVTLNTGQILYTPRD